MAIILFIFAVQKDRFLGFERGDLVKHCVMIEAWTSKVMTWDES